MCRIVYCIILYCQRLVKFSYVVQEYNVGHGHPNENTIIEKVNVGTNLMMKNGISKQWGTGLGSENGKNVRVIVLNDISMEGKIFSLLMFPFLFCNQFDVAHHNSV